VEIAAPTATQTVMFSRKKIAPSGNAQSGDVEKSTAD
jgi:hypothetical protein